MSTTAGLAWNERLLPAGLLAFVVACAGAEPAAKPTTVTADADSVAGVSDLSAPVDLDTDQQAPAADGRGGHLAGDAGDAAQEVAPSADTDGAADASTLADSSAEDLLPDSLAPSPDGTATDAQVPDTAAGSADAQPDGAADVSLPACATNSALCDDGLPCTKGACDLAVGCTQSAAADKTPCGEGLWCQAGNCVLTTCGNGKLDAGEACDDGNFVPGDGCSASCQLEVAPDMVAVPAGPFWMGARPGDYGCNIMLDQCSPGHYVWLSTYAIDRFEVTQSQYKECVDAGACAFSDVPLAGPVTASFTWFEMPAPTYLGGLQGPNLPMFNLQHSQAEQYCAWKGRRLPTEAEWEKAARGGCEFYEPGQCATQARLYPWGDTDADCSLAVVECTDDCGSTSDEPLMGCGFGLMPVGSKPQGASVYGVHDMVGNVAEWTDDWYDTYKTTPVVDPVVDYQKAVCLFPIGCVKSAGGKLAYFRIIRGPRASTDHRKLECRELVATSAGKSPVWPYVIGVRCATSLPSPKPPATFP